MMFMPMFSPVRQAAPAGVTMVAGRRDGDPGEYLIGYSVIEGIGALSQQPVPGLTIIELLSDNNDDLMLLFEGDVVSEIENFVLYINDVPVVISSADSLDYYEDLGTGAFWRPAPFLFEEGHSYNIRIE